MDANTFVEEVPGVIWQKLYHSQVEHLPQPKFFAISCNSLPLFQHLNSYELDY